MGKKPTRIPSERSSWYESLFTEAPVMYVVTREERGVPVVAACNELFARTLGYRPRDVVGRSLLDFMAAGKGFATSRNTAQPEVDLETRDGRVLHALMHACSDVGEDGFARGHRVAFIDVTEEKQMVRSLREREESLRALLDAIPDRLIRIRRRDGKLNFEPARRPRLLGLEDLADVETCHSSLPHAAIRLFERPFEMAMLGATPTVRYELEVDWETRNLEARLVKISTNEALAIVRDVTGQTEVERQLQESQRLEALGRLAGGIAHDFNNLLTVIAGNAELLLMDQGDGEAPDDCEIQGIADAARRASELTRQLLAFSSKQKLEPRAVDLNDLLRGMERMLRRLIGEDIRIQIETAEDLGTIVADPGQIERVIMNLAVNARDAMPNGGTLCFRTEACDLSVTHVGEDLRIPSGSYARLTVSDTGVGMDANARAHIFEPFYTTKANGKGTGLGLSTVYGIVKQSSGHVWVYSEPGMGTVFKIYFPRHEGSEVAVFVEEVSTSAASAGETVLLVEDDVGVLDLAHSILTRSGYHVIRAPDGDRALKIAADYHEKIDLVATDVVMPGMSGPELAGDLEKLRPGVKVLYMSGYANETVQRYGVPESGSHFLEKPYRGPELLKAVRNAIDARVAAQS